MPRKSSEKKAKKKAKRAAEALFGKGATEPEDNQLEDDTLGDDSVDQDLDAAMAVVAEHLNSFLGFHDATIPVRLSDPKDCPCGSSHQPRDTVAAPSHVRDAPHTTASQSTPRPVSQPEARLPVKLSSSTLEGINQVARPVGEIMTSGPLMGSKDWLILMLKSQKQQADKRNLLLLQIERESKALRDENKYLKQRMNEMGELFGESERRLQAANERIAVLKPLEVERYTFLEKFAVEVKDARDRERENDRRAAK